MTTVSITFTVYRVQTGAGESAPRHLVALGWPRTRLPRLIGPLGMSKTTLPRHPCVGHAPGHALFERTVSEGGSRMDRLWLRVGGGRSSADVRRRAHLPRGG